MVDILDDLLGGVAPETTATDRCHLCQAAGRGTCRACQKGMCEAHAWTMMGVCTGCARSDRMARFHRQAEPEARNWLEDQDGP